MVERQSDVISGERLSVRLVGNIFGDFECLGLLDIRPTRSYENRYRWVCRCQTCGRLTARTTLQLRRSRCLCVCGAARTYNGGRQREKRGYSHSIVPEWWWNKLKTRQTKHTIDITHEYTISLYKHQEHRCALTGMCIWFAQSQGKGSTTASLDRIDSTKGYIEGNVQWVHRHVNMMKQAYEQSHFIEMCRLVANHADAKERGLAV